MFLHVVFNWLRVRGRKGREESVLEVWQILNTLRKEILHLQSLLLMSRMTEREKLCPKAARDTGWADRFLLWTGGETVPCFTSQPSPARMCVTLPAVNLEACSPSLSASTIQGDAGSSGTDSFWAGVSQQDFPVFGTMAVSTFWTTFLIFYWKWKTWFGCEGKVFE